MEIIKSYTTWKIKRKKTFDMDIHWTDWKKIILSLLVFVNCSIVLVWKFASQSHQITIQILKRKQTRRDTRPLCKNRKIPCNFGWLNCPQKHLSFSQRNLKVFWHGYYPLLIAFPPVYAGLSQWQRSIALKKMVHPLQSEKQILKAPSDLKYQPKQVPCT